VKLLVTGAAGFIGTNFVRYWLARHPADDVITVDALTYAGNRTTALAVLDPPADLGDLAVPKAQGPRNLQDLVQASGTGPGRHC
jgi:dTDP-glucose 4,6-dehydratase